ncbi:hypothetical protein BH23ACT5_BH23ACT5_14880 [soil metagenome]
MRVLRALILILSLTLVGCGSEQSSTGPTPAGATVTNVTAAADTSPDPTVAPATTAAAEPDVTGEAAGDNPGDWSAACVNVVVELLKAMEPLVEGVDLDDIFEDPDFLADELAQIGIDHEQGMSEHCPETDNEPAYRQMIAIAGREAPGAVAYLEFFAEQAAFREEMEGGDCLSDIIAFEALVDSGGGSIEDLSQADQLEASRLVTSILLNCPPEVAEEFRSR